MNIENSSVLAKLFKTDTGSSVISAATGGAEGFAEALQEQLEELTGLDVETLIEQQQNQGLSAEQLLATLTGKALPDGIAEIDLEQTLTALNKVLAHLEKATEGLSLKTGLSEESLAEIKQLLASIDSATGLTDLNQILVSEENIKALQNLTQLINTGKKELEQELVSDSKVSANLASLLKQVQAAENVVADSAIKSEEHVKLGFDKEAYAAKIAKTNDIINAAKQEALDKVDSKLLKTSDEQSVTKSVLNMLPTNRSHVASDYRPQTSAITQPINNPGWGKELGEKVVWMFNKTVPSAEIRLNPQHLGPVSIKLDVSQDQASIAFTAQNAVVKEAIEQALPKLREMLSAQQLNLTDVSVAQNQTSDQGQSRGFDRTAQEQNQRQNANNQKNVADTSNADDDLINEMENGRAVASKGLLSLYV